MVCIRCGSPRGCRSEGSYSVCSGQQHRSLPIVSSLNSGPALPGLSAWSDAGFFLLIREPRWGTITSSAYECKFATSHRNRSVAASAPESCATTNNGTSAGRMPAKIHLLAAPLSGAVDAVRQPNLYSLAQESVFRVSRRRRDWFGTDARQATRSRFLHPWSHCQNSIVRHGGPFQVRRRSWLATLDVPLHSSGSSWECCKLRVSASHSRCCSILESPHLRLLQSPAWWRASASCSLVAGRTKGHIFRESDCTPNATSCFVNLG